MKARVYLRVAKTRKGFKVVANNKPMFESLYSEKSYNRTLALPTVAIALDLDIPDSEFAAARIVLEAKITETVAAVKLEQFKQRVGQ